MDSKCQYVHEKHLNYGAHRIQCGPMNRGWAIAAATICHPPSLPSGLLTSLNFPDKSHFFFFFFTFFLLFLNFFSLLKTKICSKNE